jgi:FkbM family methyltransferase
MNFPGKKKLRHWFWVLAFKYPRFRIVLTRLLVPSRETRVQIFGADLCINTREEIGLWRASRMAEENVIFRDEAASLVNLALLLQPGDTFVDVGANVGLYSSILSRFHNVFPQSSCVAIEANPETAVRLRQSVRQGGVTVLNIGVSSQRGELHFEPGVTSGVFKVAAAPGAKGAVQIQCDALDALSLPPTDLVVKIDVEEHELQVLEGAKQLFAAGRIKVIYLDGYTGSAIPDFLRQKDFVLFEGRTLRRCDEAPPAYSLLGIHRTRLLQS